MMHDARGVIADCRSDAHVHIEPGSPTIERNDLGAALVICWPSSQPHVRDNAIIVRGRTRFGLAVGLGAAPTIEGNEISWHDGFAIGLSTRAAGVIRNNVIRDSRTGILVLDRATSMIEENDVEATTTGILVQGADPVVTGNLISGTAPGGIVVTGRSHAVLERNAVDTVRHSLPVSGSPSIRPGVDRSRGGAP